MLKKHQFILAILIAFAISVTSWIIVYADQPPIQHDYIQNVGKNYVFVMLSTYDPSNWAADIQDKNIRSKYSQSGLYQKDNSLKPLWVVDWYAFQVDISTDGKFMVRWGDWPVRSNYDAMAITFYENGKEIKLYTVSDLVTFPMLLPESVTHYEWKKESSFDNVHKLLQVSTLSGEEYTFDITTGKILKGIHPQARRIFLEFSVTVVIAFAGLILFRYIKRQKSATQ